MAWRIILIQNPANLTIERGQITVNNDQGVFTLPPEDMMAIILESPQIILSSYLLSHCQSHNMVLITCDDKHIPNGILLPFLPHSRVAQIAILQQTWTLPLRKRLWQKIVQTKIRNQAQCLERVHGDEMAKRLKTLTDTVDSGDPKNVEATAARYYWISLFGNDFARTKDDIRNAGLNYGYAIVRAMMARALVGFGLITNFGLHHDNDLNAFNLADDMMEMFRPFVDFHVLNLIKNQDTETASLSKEMRQDLVKIGQSKCEVAGEVYNLTQAMEIIVPSLVEAIRQKDHALLKCPNFFIES